jgi:hypothetical protein
VARPSWPWSSYITGWPRQRSTTVSVVSKQHRNAIPHFCPFMRRLPDNSGQGVRNCGLKADLDRAGMFFRTLGVNFRVLARKFRGPGTIPKALSAAPRVLAGSAGALSATVRGIGTSFRTLGLSLRALADRFRVPSADLISPPVKFRALGTKFECRMAGYRPDKNGGSDG